MDFFKKLDVKSWFIIILGIALIISFFFGQRSHIDTHKDEITILHNNDVLLLKANDSLKTVNAKLDSKIIELNNALDINNKALADTQLELEKLKKRKNEISSNVNHLSANGISSDFSDYLKTRTKSTDTH